MLWSDEGFLLSRNNYSENSIIIEVFTLNHGKYTGIVYGGSSSKQKRNFQIGNKMILNWKSKNENRNGYFTAELIDPIAPFFFDDKKRSACILAASSILKILLPERQINKIIYKSFETFLENLSDHKWFKLYILWELNLIKELGFEINFLKDINIKKDKPIINFNNTTYQIPKIIYSNTIENNSKTEVKEGLLFNKKLLIENFIEPNKIRLPLYRNLLESYFS